MDSVLLPNEIEIYIEAMKPQNIEDIGSKAWIEFHERLQKLNQEALVEASALKEEHVKETLVTYGKVNTVIHEAILINIWKHKIFPVLLNLEPNPESTILAYTILYHEAVCITLLELAMFHPNTCEVLEDSAADLLDYLAGNVTQLLSLTYKEAQKKESARDEMFRQRQNLSFDIGIRSLTIIRFLSENFDRLPLCICKRMFNTHDIPVLFTEILQLKPWSKNGKLYISGGQWKIWNPEQLSQTEGQIWLTLRQLLLDPECPKQYHITDSRKFQLVKLLPLLSPIILDQLSPLIELKHWLCQLTMMEQTAQPSNPILLEPILEIKENIMRMGKGRWKKIAQKQRHIIFSNDKNYIRETAKKLNEAYNTELLEKFEINNENSSTCNQCGKTALQRCSRCKKVWYCGRACQVNNWPQHKENCGK